MLCTEHLTKDYGRARALDDLNLSIAAGEVFGLLGPNGSGKSTALRLVLGFLKPTAGNATVAGHDSWRDGVAARKHIAYLPGELRLYENMTGAELIAFLGKLRGQPPRGDLLALAKRFEIDVSRPIASLSSGMKRKIALLQVLAPEAPLLIMDEPTNALDPTMRDELLEQVRRAKARGQTVVFSSHVLAEVEAVCDRVAVLRRGKLVHLQSMAQLQSTRLITARYPAGVSAPAVDAVPKWPGLHVKLRNDDQLVLEHAGELSALLTWLSAQPIVDLRCEPFGLASIYARFHGDAA